MERDGKKVYSPFRNTTIDILGKVSVQWLKYIYIYIWTTVAENKRRLTLNHVVKDESWLAKPLRHTTDGKVLCLI